MASIEELVVRAKPEGLQETSQGFNDMQDELEETEEQMGDSADQFGGMAAKWKGALGAITAGLSVAVGGLLTQVPVLDETMGALGGIITGIAFKIDQDLRPAVGGLNEDLRETQTEVYESESAFGALEAGVTGVKDAVENFTVTQIQNEIETLTGIRLPEDWIELGLDFVTMDIRGIFKNGRDVIRNFKSDYMDVSRQVANAVLGEFDKLTRKAGKKWENFKQDLIGGAKDIWNGVKQRFRQLKNGLTQEAKETWRNVKQWFQSLKRSVTNELDELIGGALSWGSDLIDNLVAGLKSKSQDVIDFFKRVLPNSISENIQSSIETRVGQTIDAGQDFARNRGSGIFNSNPNVYIDGRDVTNETGRYRRDSVSRRGRNG